MIEDKETDYEKLAIPIPTKRYFTISEVSELCQVKPHVLRYWEQEFNKLRPNKRGNRRYYQYDEVLLVRKIRDLLYGQLFTIKGARAVLDEEFTGKTGIGKATLVESGMRRGLLTESARVNSMTDDSGDNVEENSLFFYPPADSEKSANLMTQSINTTRIENEIRAIMSLLLPAKSTDKVAQN